MRRNCARDGASGHGALAALVRPVIGESSASQYCWERLSHTRSSPLQRRLADPVGPRRAPTRLPPSRLGHGHSLTAMCLTSHLAAKLALMGTHETIAFTTTALEEMLREHGPCACGAVDSGAITHDALPSELTTGAIAFALGKPESSVRRAIAAGVFGDPRALKPNGKAYRVPRGVVDQIDKQLAEGRTLVELAAALTQSAAAAERTEDTATNPPRDASSDGRERGPSTAVSTGAACAARELVTAAKFAPPSIIARGAQARTTTREHDVAPWVPSLGEWRQHIRK